MSKNFVVAYLSSKYVNINSLDNFILNYSKFDPGCEHKLVICFKNLTSEEIAIRKKKLINIKCDYFIDYEKKNDFEWGTLKRLCQKYNKDIFWLHDHSYPRVKGWLRNIVEIYNKKTIVGCSSSFSSHYSNAFYRKKDDTYLQIIIKIIKYFFLFPKFPNPHLRTTGFLINASDFLMFIKDKKIDSKIDSFKVESGYNSLTNFFLKNEFKIKIVNSDKKSFDLNKSQMSETFAFKQNNLNLISDNQTREFESYDEEKKNKKRLQVWGK
jgi:hypothetical protein